MGVDAVHTAYYYPMIQDYTPITEIPGSLASHEQLARLYQRYRMAADYCHGRRVLEVACGAGMGLGYLARTARSVIGGDYTESLLRIAQCHYHHQVPLIRLDGHALPFSDHTFDLIVLFEAIYYLQDAEQVVTESRRVLADSGTLLICMVNKDWDGFAPSPFSTRYFSLPELCGILEKKEFTSLHCFGAFPATAVSLKQKIVAWIRRLSIALNLMPKTLASRARLKRLFYGRLTPLKPEVEDGMAELYPLVPVARDALVTDYKILYVVARPKDAPMLM